jgi:hypothetical protein
MKPLHTESEYDKYINRMMDMFKKMKEDYAKMSEEERYEAAFNNLYRAGIINKDGKIKDVYK